MSYSAMKLYVGNYYNLATEVILTSTYVCFHGERKIHIDLGIIRGGKEENLLIILNSFFLISVKETYVLGAY